ncbi:MAG: 3-deoxy-D-arabino-heptulosonate 7-phosphate synthase [Alcaligenaceae bacterium]|nr:3-deoxy-D-arabino-heptulosonate 7-phosphate synthase [Alcaligenaceae bacterium]
MHPAFSFEQFLRGLPHRYRLPELAGDGDALASMSSEGNRFSARLAMILEQARRALAVGDTPGRELEQAFIAAMAGMIQEAAQDDGGDPVFQAMVLEHHEPVVSEYTALARHFQPDRRRVQGLINAIAHPEKLKRQPPGPLRNALAQLRNSAAAAHWPSLPTALQQALSAPAAGEDSDLASALTQLLAEPALQRLVRLDTLRGHKRVQQYLALREQQGPRANSEAAARQGAEGRRRGMGVETLAAQALQALALRLDRMSNGATRHQVVTSMHVPASLSAGHQGAKTEWDVVLLKQVAETARPMPVFDVCLLLEAKASPDAVGTDLPRLLRGLRLLAAAQPGETHVFKAREGEFPVRGASLNALPTEAARLAGTVLYCSDAPADPQPRLLSASSRMKLLSAPESLAFATALRQQGAAEPRWLEPLWQQLLSAPEWKVVLFQTFAMQQARELMVHADDLLAGAA